MSDKREDEADIVESSQEIGGLKSVFIAPGRSILKHNSTRITDDRENITMSNIPSSISQLDKDSILEGNNTTSRINTSLLQSKIGRRVSFAPDVTLHRFDFVPQESANLREPRRRASTVQKETSNEQEKSKSTSLIENFVNDELTEDHRIEKDSQEILPSSNQSYEAANGITQENTSPSKSEALFDQEVSMEITQLFSKHSAKPDNLHEKGEEQSTRNLEAVPKTDHIATDMEKDSIDDSSAGNQQLPSYDTDEESMEITALQKIVYKGESEDFADGNNAEKVSVVDRVSQDSSHDMNEINNEKDGESIELTDLHMTRPNLVEETMELTKIQKPENNPQGIKGNESVDVHSHNQIQQLNTDVLEFRPSQMITSTQQTAPQTGSDLDHRLHSVTTSKVTPRQPLSNDGTSDRQPQSKRRKLSVEHPLNEIHEESSLRKEYSDNSEEIDFSVMERLSPISIPDSAMKDAGSSKFDPKGNSQLANINPEDDTSEAQEVGINVRPISLQQFLSATGVNFTLENDISETSKMVSFDYIDRNYPCSAAKVYDSLYADMPMLEIYAFCCKELIRRIKESKKLFSELDEQVSKNAPPLLFTEYFEASESVRSLMNEQIHLIKSYSRLEAKKVWFEWRSQHLKGIKSVLKENSLLLKEEEEAITNQIKEATGIKQRVIEIKQSLVRELQLAKEIPHFSVVTPKLETRLKLENLKEELRKNMVKVESITSLENERDRLQAEALKLSSKISDVKREITALSADIRKNKIYTEHDLGKLRKKLETFEKISGLKLVKFSGTKLTIEITSAQLQIELDILNTENVREARFTVADSLTDIERALYGRFLEDARQKVPDVLSYVLEAREDYYTTRILVTEFEKLSALFPTRIMRDSEGFETIQIRIFDPTSNFKVFCFLLLDEFIHAATHKKRSHNAKIKFKVIYGHNLNPQIVENYMKTRTNDVLPWLNDCEFCI